MAIDDIKINENNNNIASDPVCLKLSLVLLERMCTRAPGPDVAENCLTQADDGKLELQDTSIRARISSKR